MQANREKIRRLMIAIDQIDEAYYKALRTLGIKENAFVLFYAIADGRAYSQKRICEEWSVPRTTLNTTVQEYVGKGYIRLVGTGHKEKEIRYNAPNSLVHSSRPAQPASPFEACAGQRLSQPFFSP